MVCWRRWLYRVRLSARCSKPLLLPSALLPVTTGENGSSGTSGESGSSGTSGISGIDGSSGTSGESGSSGTSGDSGSSGTSGITGSSGTSGETGAAGTAGTSGVSGNGTAGTSGASGASGTAGTSGVSVANSLRIYSVVINTLGGSLSSVASATDPDGNSLIGASGWTFTVVSASQFRIAHPLGDVFIGSNSAGINGAVVTRRVFFGNNTSTYSMLENSTYTQIDYYTVTAVQGGYASTGSSTLTIYLMAKV